jgi:hypothetical protein
MFLFALGHTVGTLPRVTHGPQEAALIGAMRSFQFPVMGFRRSYWEFYRGFSLTISVQLVVLGAIAWQLGSISRRMASGAMPMAASLLLACLGTAGVSWKYFFTGPIVMSVLAVLLAATALVSLAREARGSADRERPTAGAATLGTRPGLFPGS